MSEADFPYIIKKQIGQGAFGNVYQVQDRNSKQQYALKQMRIQDLDAEEIVKLTNEYSICCALDHLNIVKTYKSFVQKSNASEQYYCLLMELADNCLTKQIKEWHSVQDWQKNNVQIILDCCAQIASAIKYIHDKNIVHRDLKPANVLIFTTSGKQIFKVADFGTAKKMMQQFTTTMCGTLNYWSPEMCLQKLNYTKSTDIWSLGCIVFEVVTGKMAFPAGNPIELIKNCIYEKNIVVNIELRKLVMKMLKIDFATRIDINTVASSLEIVKQSSAPKSELLSLQQQIFSLGNQKQQQTEGKYIRQVDKDRIFTYQQHGSDDDGQ